MSSQNFQNDLNAVLRLVAKKLDLDRNRYQKAVAEYESISTWLNAYDSSLGYNLASIYSQGSFNLGTIVKPVNTDEDFDVDLVCELIGITSADPPKNIKQIVGSRLRESEKYSRLIKEKNRCWRIEFPGDFHLDVLPAIPDEEKGGNAILVSDKELADWTPSNPKDYSSWFFGRMREQFTIQRELLAKTLDKQIEEIPANEVKTTLQQAIQLLKRNRDRYFVDREDQKPISIIINTLSALVYKNQSNLFGTLETVVAEMPGHIQSLSGVYWVSNPTNPDENFADKWKGHPERAEAYFEWVMNIKGQLLSLKEATNLREVEKQLHQMFGENVVSESIKEIEQISALPASIVESSRFNLPHRKPLKWGFAKEYDISISAVRKAGKVIKGVMPRAYPNNGSPIPKHYSLEFTAMTNADQPHTIEWQVINTGEEARQANGLRGGFVNSSGIRNGSFYRVESTLYRGCHSIEAFVILGERCVGRSGEFIVNIK